MNEVRYKHSSNNGYMWDPDIRITEYSYGIWNPSIAASGDYIHIVWHDCRDLGAYKEQIRYRRSTDNGTTWEQEIRLSEGSKDSWYPSIGASGSNVHVVWEDWRDGNREIYYKRSTDAGLTWGPDTRLTYSSTGSYGPNIAVSGDNIHIAWIDQSSGQYEVYYKCSTDNGITWGSDTRLTYNPAGSYGHSIAISGTKVHVLWFDERDGNSEIYYKHNPTGNSVAETFTSEIPNEYFTSATLFTNHIPLGCKKNCNLPLRVSLYNIYGALVFEKTFSYTPSFLKLEGREIEALPSSIYFLSICSGKRNLKPIKIIKP